MSAEAFVNARDFLQKHRTDYKTAVSGFRWPVLDTFNWATDYFDAMAKGNTRPGLCVVEENGTQVVRTFAELSERSNRVASFLRTSAPPACRFPRRRRAR